MGPLDTVLQSLAPWLYSIPPGVLRWSLLTLTAAVTDVAGNSNSASKSKRRHKPPP